MGKKEQNGECYKNRKRYGAYISHGCYLVKLFMEALEIFYLAEERAYKSNPKVMQVSKIPIIIIIIATYPIYPELAF